jgi:hypothetical protein
MKFQEYLDKNNKLQTSGKVKTIADYEGKVDTKPVKEKKHKDAGGKGQDGELKPYKGGTDAKDPNKGKLNDGFASKGDKKLKYAPKNGVPAKEGGKKTATWPKTKTQEWIDRTKGMSLAEFTKNLRSEAFKGLDECACQEAPHNAIKETISVCKCNQKYISALVREMKRNGMFGRLFGEMIQHPEAYKVLAKLMEKDESYSRKLVKAMNEIGDPMGGMGSDPMGGPMGGPPMPKKKKKPMPPMHGGMGDDLGMGDDDMDMHGDHDDMDDDNMDDMGDDSDDMDVDDMGDDDMGDEHGDMDMDDMGDDDGGIGDLGDDGGDPDEDGGMGHDIDGGVGGPPMPPHDKIGKLPPPKKHKKGIDHLMGALKNHANMMGGM